MLYMLDAQDEASEKYGWVYIVYFAGSSPTEPRERSFGDLRTVGGMVRNVHASPPVRVVSQHIHFENSAFVPFFNLLLSLGGAAMQTRIRLHEGKANRCVQVKACSCMFADRRVCIVRPLQARF